MLCTASAGLLVLETVLMTITHGRDFVLISKKFHNITVAVTAAATTIAMLF